MIQTHTYHVDCMAGCGNVLCSQGGCMKFRREKTRPVSPVDRLDFELLKMRVAELEKSLFGGERVD